MHLLEAFVFYFHEQTSKIRQLLDEGEIGELLQMAVHFCFRLPRDRPNIRLDKDLGGGALLDVGSYAITFVRFAFDEEPVSVQASVYVDPEYGVDTRTSAILEFAEGRSAVVQVGMDSPVGPGAILMTSKGVLEVPQPFHPRTDAQLVVRRIGDYPTRADVVEKMPFGSDGQPFAPALETGAQHTTLVGWGWGGGALRSERCGAGAAGADGNDTLRGSVWGLCLLVNAGLSSI